MSAERKPLLCPSAQADWKGSVIFGVMQGTAMEPRMTPLEEALPVTFDILELCKGVSPSEVYRFAAPCANAACQHFSSGTCRLAKRIVSVTSPVTSDLPLCAVREQCRWFAQEGSDACYRCPQIVTNRPTLDKQLRWLAAPEREISDTSTFKRDDFP